MRYTTDKENYRYMDSLTPIQEGETMNLTIRAIYNSLIQEGMFHQQDIEGYLHMKMREALEKK